MNFYLCFIYYSMGVIDAKINGVQVLQQALKKIDQTQQELLMQGKTPPQSITYYKKLLTAELNNKSLTRILQQADPTSDFVTKTILVITSKLAEMDISALIGNVVVSPDPAMPMIYTAEKLIDGKLIEEVNFADLAKSTLDVNQGKVSVKKRYNRASGVIEKGVIIQTEIPVTDAKLLEYFENDKESIIDDIADDIVMVKNAQIIAQILRSAEQSQLNGRDIVIDATISNTYDGYRKTLIDIRRAIEDTANAMASLNKRYEPNIIILPKYMKPWIRDAYEDDFKVLKRTPTIIIAQAGDYIFVFQSLILAGEGENDKAIFLINNPDTQSVIFSIPQPLTFQMEMNDARTLSIIKSVEHIYGMYFYKPQYYMATANIIVNK